MESYLKLVKQVRDAVREKAQEIPLFKKSGNGAICILAYPRCAEADEWLGGLGEFRPKHQSVDSFTMSGWDKRPDDIPDYAHVFPITSGGSCVVTFQEPDGSKHKCNCFAYAMMKIANCSLAQHMGIGLRSGLDLNDPDVMEENGYGPYKGAICAEINTIIGEKSEPFCGIYVCVSGAADYDDESCAIVGIEVVRKFFHDERSTFGPLEVVTYSRL
ncbi:hypothetical protein IK146_01765 [Candidatus Saccharibacteria bacterium]|nr:hypothetical protein [Candidatus Saccharibacteria bacterium]